VDEEQVGRVRLGALAVDEVDVEAGLVLDAGDGRDEVFAHAPDLVLPLLPNEPVLQPVHQRDQSQGLHSEIIGEVIVIAGLVGGIDLLLEERLQVRDLGERFDAFNFGLWHSDVERLWRTCLHFGHGCW
jgi:hypothetical protein